MNAKLARKSVDLRVPDPLERRSRFWIASLGFTVTH
jgi:hypothetical protein